MNQFDDFHWMPNGAPPCCELTLTRQRHVTFLYAGEYYFNDVKACYIGL